MGPKLVQLGWNDELARAWQAVATDTLVPGRVIADYGTSYKIAIPQEIQADASGRLQYLLETFETPKVGDWVAIKLLDNGQGVIHHILPRSSEISRRRPGEKYEKQILATNIDLAFLVQALDDDFSPERLRRYAFQLQKEGIRTIIVLNKLDKVDDLEARLKELESFEFEILLASAITHKGIDEIASKIEPGTTAVFLGSSGVGKSTITNQLLGEQRQKTKSVRDEDSKGMHTTTHRELFILPNGGLIVDTPGLRELQLWGTESDLDAAYPEIEALARQCKFSNCTHTTEPNCAINNALDTGELDESVLHSYFKFQKELRYLKSRVDINAAIERKINNKKIQKDYRKIVKEQKRQSLD